ncbi:Putrescine transport system permease protein potH [Magnetospirillum gryphiswaldense MSR-1 v2]|uniref:Putrescine transport system permease protein potH n=1 Tax=Magnetospirillum gryphiswaldense (strain DSM 6361 / JCM 21280 / NBRC 15271 / MSR-1) TaxID=431944 RepID=V6F450_MAGGM|nr:ABC transporter permease subunit [Magnetospirillum gryphiswaldense]CDK99076.1 Putrescine transport system permease protein potH [Magnetospirillum gryphiswaldense MSR-1 v2]
MRVASTRRDLGRRLVLAVPYVWLLVFFLAPLLIVGKISLSESRLGIPPYEPLIDWAESGLAMVKASFNNYALLFEDDLYVQAYIQSLTIAGISTILCLLIGYPMALGIARAPEKARGPLLLLVIVPFWTSFLIRVYSWMSILRDEGILNHALMGLGLIDEPLVILNTDWAVYVGIVYSYLPFMVLPLYATLEKLDPSLLEAAADLGARPIRAFIAVTLPLSLPGIVAGSLLVFVPAVGEYVIPNLLGGGDTQMLGKALWDVFAQTRDWPSAAALAVAMLVALVIPIALFQRLQTRLEEQENR